MLIQASHDCRIMTNQYAFGGMHSIFLSFCYFFCCLGFVFDLNKFLFILQP